MRSEPPPEVEPRWAPALLRRLARPEDAAEVLGDLEEAHRIRRRRHGRFLAGALTALDALDMAWALLRERRRGKHLGGASTASALGRTGRSRLPPISWLDFKLGLRMLVRHPGLTVVGTLAMAFGIAVGTAAFELGKDVAFPEMPYVGESVVRLQNVDVRTGGSRSFLHDFAAWRDELRSVETLAAYDDMERNLSLEGGPDGPVVALAVGAAAFELLPVSPLIGRPLLPSDEAPGAPAVAVIGQRLWQRRFGGDPAVVGRVARLGDEPTTVVGVMPEGFALSVESEEDVWVPLRPGTLANEPGAGPRVSVIGRLAPGTSLEQAQAELDALGESLARQWPDTHEHLRPRLGTYPPTLITEADLFMMGAAATTLLIIVAIMVLVSANVALLLFARAAAREGEIAVRSALGASRSRIVAQLFAEALALAGVAALVGVGAASVALPWAIRTFEAADASELPFWIGDSLSPATMAYAALLALFGAAVAGVLPGLRVTGRQGTANLQRVAARSFAAGPGSIWSAIIVTQVALTVIVVPLVARVGLGGREIRSFDPGFPSAEFLSVRLEMDESEDVTGGADSEEFVARYEESQRTLAQRLAAEPGVIGVASADPVPGAPHRALPVEIDGVAAAPTLLWNRAQQAAVGIDFFEVVGARIVSGRGFGASDFQEDAPVVVVNESFVRELLGGRNAVGQRLRYLDPVDQGAASSPDVPNPWHEIIGVARDVAMTIDADVPHNAGIYHPLVTREAYPLQLAVHLAGEPLAFTGRIRELAAEVDPALRVQGALPLDQVTRRPLIVYDSWFRILLIVGALALLLTEAGIYSIVSYTVSRRTREVGIRVALGADRRRVAGTILSRMAWQVALGVLLGCALLMLGIFGISDVSEAPPRPTVAGALLLLGHMATMTVVCMLACAAPARRALRIQPTEALSSEG